MRFLSGIIAAVRGSLKLKLTLLILTILGFTIGIAPWSAIKMQERQLLQAYDERLRALHEMLGRTIVASCMLTGNANSVQKVIETVSSHHEVENVRLFDARGVIRYSSLPEERGRQLSRAEIARFYGRTDPVLVSADGGAVTYTLVQPMFNQPACSSCHPSDQKVLGILQVSLSLDRMWGQLAVLKRSAAVATAITLGVIVICIWLSLTLLIDQPLQQLVDVMGRAEAGELSIRAETRNNDEIGKLARHFNDMISQLQSAQQEIQRYHQEQLARADRLATIGEMAAAIAHEIRNPLTGISGVLSVVSRDFAADDPRREIFRQTHLLIDRLNKSVESILHYSRPSLPQLQAVKVDDIVEQTLLLVAGEAKKAHIQLLKERGDGEAITVDVDAHQIQQVLMNIVLNAIQASGAGGQVAIRTRLLDDDAGKKQVRIEVEDEGKGMTPDEVARAFNPFFSTKPQGTGLGLAIAKQIVEQHGGRISLSSVPGKGTCVAVDLPLEARTA
jgi:two-component system NtrC family sensor kinase